MLDFILCRDFFNKKDIEPLRGSFTNNIFSDFEDTKYGLDSKIKIQTQNVDLIMKKILNVPVTILKNKSGIVRKPHNCLIHFEDFETTKEWCFVVALERTTFNLHKHSNGSISALQSTNVNYRYTPEWDYYLNVLLEPNQGVFFRPWYFHSLENGLTLNYKFTIDY